MDSAQLDQRRLVLARTRHFTEGGGGGVIGRSGADTPTPFFQQRAFSFLHFHHLFHLLHSDHTVLESILVYYRVINSTQKRLL